MTTYEKLFTYASGMYLTDRVPDGYTDWDEDKLIAFVADHMVDIFDHLDPPDVLSEIEQAADHWWAFIRDNV
jgi:hypothetical protein